MVRIALHVLRSEATGAARWQAYEVELAPGATVLGALEAARSGHDASLGFRSGCSAKPSAAEGRTM